MYEDAGTMRTCAILPSPPHTNFATATISLDRYNKRMSGLVSASPYRLVVSQRLLFTFDPLRLGSSYGMIPRSSYVV